MTPIYEAGLVWLRRDLRAHDHAALARALAACRQVHCVFVFDRALLDPLPRRDRRVEFIREALADLDRRLRSLAGPQRGLIVLHGPAVRAVPDLARQLGVQAVFLNHDHEPAAEARDGQVRQTLAAAGIALHGFKDQVVFEGTELRTQAGAPYSVFTPYQRAWLARLTPADLAPHDCALLPERLAPRPAACDRPVPTLAELGFEPTDLAQLGLGRGSTGGAELLRQFAARLDSYAAQRDFPALDATSRLGVHLRFGTLSVRELLRLAQAATEAGSAGAIRWRSELIWREFFFQVLANFPQVQRGASLRPEYDAIRWEQGPAADALFDAWCHGRTGYPLVDAAMLQLLHTGFMHNRLRMVTASFLCKDLGLDWRRGERWFAERLNDYELASNNGGWQWAASTGCDAQPWFRIFNPVTQSRKFDPEGAFIARWLPQLAGLAPTARHAPWLAGALELAAAGVVLGRDYPWPVVDHGVARARTLARYGVVKGNGKG